MHIKGFLHKLLSPVTHKKRLTTLALLVETVIKSKKLSLSALARALPHTTQERHAIKRVDKFLGNTKLHKERETIYKIGIDYLLGSSKRPIIIVDWSNIPNTTNYLLRAALVTQGRALPSVPGTVRQKVVKMKSMRAVRKPESWKEKVS